MNPNTRRKEWKPARLTIGHISSVIADSVAVMPRTATVTLPYMTALASANSAPTWSESAPGLATMRTPKKPASSAAQRAAPARSLSHSTDSSADHSGAEKLIAMAPASGIRLNAITVKVWEIDCDRPRAMWSRGLRVANTERPVNGSTKPAHNTSEKTAGKNTPPPPGWAAPCHLAKAFEIENSTVA